MNGKTKAAAFYDLEGTLLSTNLVHILWFHSRRQQGIWKTAKSSISTLAKLPMFAATDLYSRNTFNEMFFKSYKGESLDRLKFFADELYSDVLLPSVYDGTLDLLKKSKNRGLRQVIITGALDFTVDKIADYFGVDDVITNRLEFVNNYATGRLLPPVMASATKARLIREYSETHDISLSDSFAYSDSIADLPMLSMVGHPVAVNPDIRLKLVADQHDWPVLDLK